MDVFLTAIGCRLNEAELQGWFRDFESAGHNLVSSLEEAELVVINTCAVTAEAARKSRKLASRLHRENPRARLVLTGCYAELEPEATAALAGVDLVINNHDKDLLLKTIECELDVAAVEPSEPLPYQPPALLGGRTRAFVKVQDGCRNRCAFCIVTVARGEERSYEIDRVVAEIDDLVGRGIQEAVLTGVHLGGYGSDIDSGLEQLVGAVLERTKIPRLRLSSLEPWDLSPRLFSLWQDPRLGQHLHLPLQSGSDRILRRMARRCDTARYAELVSAAREAIPDVVITTDVIVGFPGETEQDWQQTVDFCRRMRFAHMHIFSYSPRVGTRAAKMGDNVPNALKRERSRELHSVAFELKQSCLERFVGSEREVLWEVGKPVDRALFSGERVAGRQVLSGLTDNYLRCVVEVPEDVDLDNRLTPARLVAIDCDHFVAELSAEVLAAHERPVASSLLI